MLRKISPLLLFLLLLSCNKKQQHPTLFQKLPASQTGIDFVNNVKNTKDFNIFSYRNFYNGGGVAIGDINNDELPDIYFTNNMGSNKLYLNKGNLTFEDITEKAGVGSPDKWSTGVVMADINNDGWLDIYVCNAGNMKGGNRENELYINQQNGTFTEGAALYNLNHNGLTTHAAFFDYDMDGDLDVYILNNSFIPVNTLNYENKRELMAADWPVRDFLKGGGDKLLRNEEGKFIDVTQEAGIYSSLIGFGLGVTVGDLNGDLLPDMYISNDFFERDYLYINQGDGTFSEEIKNWMEHISLFSMGADMADINNDGYPEVFVTDMLPGDDYRLKTTTNFDNYNVYDLKLKRDFYHQFMQNTLQFNNRDGTFSEIAHYSGVSASDWSWGALLFDMDNDGYRDIYICNGIYHDVTDQDFIDFFANDVVQKMVLTGEKEDVDSVINKMPSTPLLNKAFRNKQDLSFEDVTENWGFREPSYSNGGAYADLDNDGDLDLVINNVNQQAFVYENKTEVETQSQYVVVRLQGSGQNTFAIGAQVLLYQGDRILSNQVIPSRGFQSSVDYPSVFGLGDNPSVDSVVVIWPDQSRSTLLAPPVNQTLVITKDEDLPRAGGIRPRTVSAPMFQEVPANLDTHQEDVYVDFYSEGLTFKMLSQEGPGVAAGDLNGDGLTDLFLGNGHQFAGKIYMQTRDGFLLHETPAFEKDPGFEDTAAACFDADNDGDLDLIIGSGGNRFEKESRLLQDRIYLNDGQGNFELAPNALPPNGMNTAVVLPFDFDEDGDQDVFIGSRSVPGVYGISPRSYLMENDGTGTFSDVTEEKAPGLVRPGMITDAIVADLTGDGAVELILAGEWMAPQIFEIRNGRFTILKSNLSDFPGWWYALEASDLDGDGDTDLVLGNRGENFYFSASRERPAKLWLADFDENGTVEKIMTRHIDGEDKTIQLKKEVTGQIVVLKKQNLRHTDFAGKSIQELFSKEALNKAQVKVATWFKSAIAYNQGGGKFDLQPLPPQAQFSCVCDIVCTDLNGDTKPDILLGGNTYGFTPQFSRLDASFGNVFFNKGDGAFARIPNAEAGLILRGEVRHLIQVTVNDRELLLVVFNEGKHKLFDLTGETTIF